MLNGFDQRLLNNFFFVVSVLSSFKYLSIENIFLKKFCVYLLMYFKFCKIVKIA